MKTAHRSNIVAVSGTAVCCLWIKIYTPNIPPNIPPNIHQIITKNASFSATELKIRNGKLFKKLQRNFIHEKKYLKSHNISRDMKTTTSPSIVSN